MANDVAGTAPRKPLGRMLLPAEPGHPRNSEATVVALEGGALLLAWSAFRGPGDDDPATIEGLRSHDGGDTWEERCTLVENTAGLNVMSPAIRRLADGSLGMVYSHRDSATNASRRFVRSVDEGRTWSPPVLLPQQEGYQTGCHDRLTVLEGGRIVAPLHCYANRGERFGIVRTAWSDDHGATWRLSGPLSVPATGRPGGGLRGGCNEPDVVERADGSLLMVLRTTLGTIFRAESRDGGETWSGLRSMEVVAPAAPSRIVRVPHSADLLLIWNWSYDATTGNGTRRPLACAISEDGGNTWPWSRRKLLEDDLSATYHYPSCVFLGQTAFITYQSTPAPREGQPAPRVRELKTLRLPLPWLYDAEGGATRAPDEAGGAPTDPKGPAR